MTDNLGVPYKYDKTVLN